MRSTSTSDQTILKLENVHLVFQVDVHKSQSWRDVFTRIAKDPISALHTQADRLTVADNVSFEVKEGDRIGLIGVNGAGKTSLCRCIAGMYRPTRGKITVNGPVRAIFSSQVGIQPELTGRENAELLAQFLFPEHEDQRQLVEDALEFSELGRFADVPYRLYSNGMQARLSLSLISAKAARLLILDEVFDGADAFFREKIANRVLDMIKKSGAVIFVSHSYDQIKKVCNRVLVLSQGKIVFDGRPDEGLKYYETVPHS